MGMFLQLCQPLRGAWTWKTMRKCVPDIYEKEVKETFEMYEAIQSQEYTNKPQMQREMLELFSILYENPKNDVSIKLISDEKNQSAWEGYIEALKNFVRQRPDARLYLKLAKAADSPYKVEIKKEDNRRYYDVRPR